MRIWIGYSTDVFCTTNIVKHPQIGELRCDKSDAVPFIYSQAQNYVIIGTSRDIHHLLWPGDEFGYDFIAGRFWVDEQIVTFYDNRLNPFPSSELLSIIVNSIKEVAKIDISNYNILKPLGKVDIDVHAIVELPVSEYISMSLTGKEGIDYFKSVCGGRNIIDTRNKEWANQISSEKPSVNSKLDRFPGEDEYTKLRKMRQWNGYMDVAESRKGKKVILSETQLRILLSEIAASEIDERAKDVNLTPSDAQKEAGNYKMAHISVKGMEIAIENPKGSKRYYTDEKTGEKKYVVMNNHYGYFNITKGKDGDAVDVFIGPEIDNFENVYCVDQNNKEGEFDETKVMLGFVSKQEAKAAYLSNYSPNWRGFRAITGVSLKHFKKWLYRGRKQRQPFADYVLIQKQKITENRIANPKQYEFFRESVENMKETIKSLDAKGGLNLGKGRIVNYTNKILRMCVRDDSETFKNKVIDRAMRELKEEGYTPRYYTPQ